MKTKELGKLFLFLFIIFVLAINVLKEAMARHYPWIIGAALLLFFMARRHSKGSKH